MANAFNLEAKIELDSKEYQEGLKKASSDFGKFGTTVKEGLAKVGQISAAAVSAAAVGVGAIVKNSVNAFADYEQLAGGIETLFGENAQKVIENSEKAFKTAGMSVNEYMETSIQSAAALINSLAGDTEQAADLMDMSITDMSDNVNKMGTTMEAVQNAYRGFSRGNFTMLDNLALGFAGTKEGMQELLDKAEQLSGVKYDISSYSDIVKAIHEVQSSMGITGTTAKEAASTITGSIASTKAAWKNLTVEMAKENGDIEKAFENLGENVGLVVDNVLPRVEKTLDGVGTLIVKAAPKISASISQVIPKIMPSLLKSATSLVGSLGKGIVSAIPDLLSASKGIASDMYDSFQGSDLGPFNWVKEDAMRIVKGVKEAFKGLDLEKIRGAFRNLGSSFNRAFEKVGDGLAWASENVISPLIEWAGNDLLPKAFDTVAGSVELLTDAFEFIKEPAKRVWEVLQPYASGTLDVIAGAFDLVSKAVGGLASEFEGVDWSGFWDSINNGDFWENWALGFKGMKDGLSENAEAIEEWFSEGTFGKHWIGFWEEVGGAVFTAKENTVRDFKTIGIAFGDFVESWTLGAQTISDFCKTVIDDINNFIETWKLGFQTLKDIREERKSTWKLGWNTLEGFGSDIFDKLHPDSNAIGNYIDRPTLTWTGEKEPEYIIPESKMDKVYPRNNGTTVTIENLNINGSFNLSDPAEQDRMIEQISAKLRMLSIKEQRALGGRGWL